MRWRQLSVVFLVVLSVLSLVSLPVGSSLGAPATSGVTQEQPDADVEFGTDGVVEQRGDYVAIPVVFEEGTTAVFEVYGPGWDVNLLVTDRDGDGRVTIVLDSARPGDPDRITTTDPVDSVSVRFIARRDTPLIPGRYDLRLRSSESAENIPLIVEERATDGVRTLHGASSLAGELDDVESIVNAREAGRLTNVSATGPFVPGEPLVVQLDGTGLGAALDAAADADPGAAPLSLQLERTGRCRATLDLVSAPAVELHADSAANQYFAVVDTAGVALSPVNRSADCSSQLASGDSLRANLTILADSSLAAAAGETTLSDPITVRGPGASFESVSVSPRRTTASGTTTLAPGSTVELAAIARGEPRGTKQVVVGPDGRFDARIQLVGVDAFDEVTVAVRTRSPAGERTRLAETRRTAEPDGPALQFVDQTTTADVTIANASLPDGGFVVLREGTVDGPVVGVAGPADGVVSALVVSPETPLAGERPLVAVLYRDTNADRTFDEGDEPYATDDGPVTTGATVTFPRAQDDTQTDTPTTTDAPTTTEAEPPTETTDEGSDDVPPPATGGLTGASRVGLFVGLLVVLGPIVFALRE